MHRILSDVSVRLNTTISTQTDSSTDFIDRADYVQQVWSVSTSGIWSLVRPDTSTRISVGLRTSNQVSRRNRRTVDVTNPDLIGVIRGEYDELSDHRIPVYRDAYGGEVQIGYLGTDRFIQLHIYFQTQNHITASVFSVVSLVTPHLYHISEDVDLTF